LAQCTAKGCKTGLIVKLGQPGDATAPTTGDLFVNFLDAKGVRRGSISGSAGGGVAYNTAGSDFAEYYAVDPSVLPTNYTDADKAAVFPTGALVCQDNNGVVPCSSTNNAQILGIVSTTAVFVGGEDGNNKVLVGLLGQLPIQV